MKPLSPEQIEALRRSGIRLDREGRLWHEGQQITHGRFQVALRKWLDRLPDGRTILRLDDTRYAYVDVDDAHLLITSIRVTDDAVILALNDGSSEELAPHTLEQSDDHALYCRVRGGTLLARFLTPAYYALAEHMEEAPSGDDGAAASGFALRIGKSLYPIGRRTSSAGC